MTWCPSHTSCKMNALPASHLRSLQKQWICMQIDLESEKMRKLKIIRMHLRICTLNCEHTLMHRYRKIRLFAVKYIYKIRRKAGTWTIRVLLTEPWKFHTHSSSVFLCGRDSPSAWWCAMTRLPDPSDYGKQGGEWFRTNQKYPVATDIGIYIDM